MVAAIVAEPCRHGVGGLFARWRGDGYGAAHDGAELVDGGQRRHLGDPRVAVGWDLDGGGGLVDAEVAGVELALIAGWVVRASARRTSWAA